MEEQFSLTGEQLIRYMTAQSATQLNGWVEEGGCSCCGQWHNDEANLFVLELGTFENENGKILQIYCADTLEEGDPELLFVPNSIPEGVLLDGYLYADDEISAENIKALNALTLYAWEELVDKWCEGQGDE